MKVTWVGMTPGTYTPASKKEALLHSKLKPIGDRAMIGQVFDCKLSDVPKYAPPGTTLTINITPENILIERTYVGTNGEPDRIWLQEY